MTTHEGRPVLGFFGGLLLALGVALGVLSGLCTLIGMTFEPRLAILIGAAPIMVGAGMWIGGMAMLKAARPPPRPVLPPAHFTDDPSDGEL